MAKEINSPQNPLIKHLVKLRENHQYRYEKGSIIIDGLKIVRELDKKIVIKTLLTTSLSYIPSHIKIDNCFLVPEQIMKKVSGLNSPEGLLVEIEMPPFSSLDQKRRLIALDGINDPGNLGTLLRTALALGWEGVFILNNSCDPFNDKALRAARGATLRIPLCLGSPTELQQCIQKNQLTPLVADTEGTDFTQLPVYNSLMLVLGNEANGPSSEVKQLCRSITIPMQGKMESLNVAVAGGILMFNLINEGAAKLE